MKPLLCALLALAHSCTAAPGIPAGLRFQFGPGPAAAGYTEVSAATIYGKDTGFGFEPGAEMKTAGGAAVSDRPFAFSAALPEGLYRVTVTLGGAPEPSLTTIKAEARRLMVEKAETAPGQTATRTFTVSVRQPELKGGGAVRLKPGEQKSRDWDEKLTLEFSNSRPALRTVEIMPAHDVTTVYLAGDSTMTDQPNEPYVGWGQMLPCFFGPDVAIANHAQSGESLRSSLAAGRFDKIFESIRPGDYLFVQFGHNDQKDKAPEAGPYAGYKETLRGVVVRARDKGALPVIVTSMERRHFEGAKIVPSLTDFAEAASQVSREEQIPLIDLHAMSIALYEAWGPELSTRAFVHFPAGTFPKQTAALKDDTHFTAYGAYELARCVVQGIRAANLPLAKAIAPGITPFDAAHPDAIESLSLPASPVTAGEKPAGS